ncbi:MAG TPA: hypothetical protein VM074_13115 [Solimonas sp.]|nr:hypothetical protein [Solimonas sp.]
MTAHIGLLLMSFSLLAGLAACGNDAQEDTGPSLVLSGEVPTLAFVTLDDNIQSANIPISGATVQAEFGTRTAKALNPLAAPGSFRIELRGYRSTDFVTLRVRGMGPKADVELVSLLGTAGRLEALAGPDRQLEVTDEPRLVLAGTSTALAGLIAQLGPADRLPVAATDADLERAEKLVDEQRIIDLGAAVELLSIDDSLTLPTGMATTYALVSDATAQRQFREQLLDQHYEAFQTRIAVIEHRSLPAPRIVRASFPLQFVVSNPPVTLPMVVELQADGSGTVALVPFNVREMPRGVSPITWSEAAGVLRLVPTDGLSHQASLEGSCPDPQWEPATYETTRTVVNIDLIPFGGSLNRPLVLTRVRWREAIPNCFVPDREYEETSAGSVQALATEGLTAAMFASHTWMLPVYNPAPAASLFGTASVLLGGDLLSFAANGTGSSQRLGQEFEWSVLADGRLRVELSNGTVFTYRRSGPVADAGVMSLMVAADLGEGNSFEWTSIGVLRDPVFAFTAATAAGEYRAFDQGIAGAIGDTITTLHADGSGTWRTVRSSPETPHLRTSTSPIRGWSVQESALVIDRATSHADFSSPGCDPQADPECFIYQRHVFAPVRREGSQLYYLRSDFYGYTEDGHQRVPADEAIPMIYPSGRTFTAPTP